MTPHIGRGSRPVRLNAILTLLRRSSRRQRWGEAMTPKQAREVLNAPAGAGEHEIGRAYRAAVKAAHPDHGGDADRLREVIEARRILKAMAVGRHAFPTAPRPQARPAPRRHLLEISVTEALFGGRRRAFLDGRTLEVKLPAGPRAGGAPPPSGAGARRSGPS